ncbi:uncharacterized protein J8A68_002489 [[Candida] subhashii]|uniref:Vta1 C-terminal domain-containing protein n=1 Tax=[Candida] subhashii TaxID=561895 RepID=A0A8J5QKV2_9ASCO|nr:uncharacterized protein J8A68_002489 [[Candida] subhashii]KAG7663988.1 hypothetical protein J8A68_002489 [[Candida] subhashii]
MTITLESIPEELKTDKQVTPFIIRSLELSQPNPIISYYCKIYVLEYILDNKLHTKSKEIETFTILLLDETESIKKSTEDEELHKVLQNSNLSIQIVISFSYKLFNSCLENLNNLTRSTNKDALIGKFRATLNFLSLVSVFKGAEGIDWGKLSGGKAENWQDFDALNKQKIKVLKYQLSRLIKGEVEYKGEPNDQELEDELNKELGEITGKDTEVGVDDIENEDEDETNKGDGDYHSDHDDGDDGGFKMPGAPSSAPANDLPNFIDLEDEPPKLPQTPDFVDEKEETDVNLPGAPHFAPSDSENETDSVKLPGAPKYLPDDDITHINKSSSIQVFPPEHHQSPRESRSSGHQQRSPPPAVRRSSASRHPPITKETIKQILNRDETISQVQKHAKFAQSALQFEDFEEAEKQLTKGLELLQVLRKQEAEEDERYR